MNFCLWVQTGHLGVSVPFTFVDLLISLLRCVKPTFGANNFLVGDYLLRLNSLNVHIVLSCNLALTQSINFTRIRSLNFAVFGTYIICLD